MTKLRRPDKFAPLGVKFATGRTGTAILNRFGVEGLGVWAAMIAAAKAGSVEGQIVFIGEDHWAAIGLETNPPNFTLKTFLTFLGRQKQTRTTRHGRVMYVQLTQWGHWNDAKNSYLSSQRSARYRQKNKRDVDVTKNVTESVRDRDTELEGLTPLEKELEPPPTPPIAASPRKHEEKPRDELWDVLIEELGEPVTQSERGRRNKALKELRDIGIEGTELKHRIRSYRRKWPDIELTATAIVANWSSLANGTFRPEPKVRCEVCGFGAQTEARIDEHKRNVHGIEVPT